MNRIARLIGLALVLLIVFLAAVLASGLRLRRHTEQLRQAAIQTRDQQLERVLSLTRPAPPPWTDAYINDLSTILDAKVEVLDFAAGEGQEAKGNGPDNATPEKQLLPSPIAPRPSPGGGPATAWQFDYTLRDDSGRSLAVLRVSAQPPPTFRLGDVYRHTAMVLLVLALGLLAVLVTALLFNLHHRSEPESQTTGSHAAIGQEFDSLTHLAKTTVQQRADLQRERGERLRADEDLHFQQILLNRSLEEKIQLGRELHDGIIQSLYATGLTFEAAKNQLSRDPVESARQLDVGLKTLNNTIRDIRSYISGLAPENLRQQNFSESVLALTQTLGGGRDTAFDLRIDEAAAARLTDSQSSDLLQIVREAVSNSLRHGAASNITIRLHENDGELGLLVQDNGKGFDPAKLTDRGHGLHNLQARADRIHAVLRVTSTPGEGTRTVITLPAGVHETKS